LLLQKQKHIDKKLGEGFFVVLIIIRIFFFFRQKKNSFSKVWMVFFSFRVGPGRWFELKKQYKNNPDVSITILAEFVVFFSGFLKSCMEQKSFFLCHQEGGGSG